MYVIGLAFLFFKIVVANVYKMYATNSIYEPTSVISKLDSPCLCQTENNENIYFTINKNNT